jgi:phosphatidylserine decarboxylase
MNDYAWPDPPGWSAYPVAKAGLPFIFASAFATAVLALLGIASLALLGLVITFSICFFFRDPDRVVPNGEGLVVSPADGKVIAVDTVSDSDYYEGTTKKISIFMSVFNVHINRVPHEGTITETRYYPGKFFSANLNKASSKNEHNAIFLKTKRGSHICFVQIAGLIARRIICQIQKGDQVRRGQRFGLICFGSRLDVYLPQDIALKVAMGDRVKAGASVLGVLKSKGR